MPALTTAHIVLLAVLAIVGVVIGWLLRGQRCAREKIAVSAGWQHQIDAQQNEHDRIAAQNTSLMERISQLQATSQDAKQRAERLKSELQEAVSRRDDLQREIRDIRNNLETALAQKERLRTDVASRSERQEAVQSRLREKDDKIARLKRELTRWQERVPPLVERYRQRDLEAQELAVELDRAHQRIVELEAEESLETRIEAVDQSGLDNLDASNDQYDDTQETESLLPATGQEAGDDLKRIKGIGPAIERSLNELGIRSYRQVAELGEPEIDRIAGVLRGAKTRIHREDWIGQAQLLLHEAADDPA